MDPPLPSGDKLNIPAIDTSVDVVIPNWAGKSEFAQGAFTSFQLDPTVQEDAFDGFAPNPLLSASPQQLSPSFVDNSTPFQLSPPMMQMPSPITSQMPSPPLFTPPPSPSPMAWAPAHQNRQLVPQIIPTQPPSPLSSSAQLPNPQLQPTPQVIQPVQTIQQQQIPKQQFTQIQPDNTKLQQAAYDNSQMLSLLLEEKPLLNETCTWQDAQFGNFVDVQAMNFACDPTLFKKPFSPQLSTLPPPMNATPLFPAPIAVFDKMKFQLLDSNDAMAKFLGCANVAEMASKVRCMDDLIDPEAAQVAKQAYANFVTNPSPCFRLGEIRTQTGNSKTVEFHVDLTEQLLIFTIKSVFDSSSQALPDVQYQPISLPSSPLSPLLSSSSSPLPPSLSLSPLKLDTMSPPLQQCNKAFEFLSPID